MANKYYVDGDPKKMKSPLRSLWAIPIMIIIDIVALVVAAWAEGQMMPTEAGQGHPFPVIIFFTCIVMAIITIIVFVVAIVKAIARAAKNSKSGTVE